MIDRMKKLFVVLLVLAVLLVSAGCSWTGVEPGEEFSLAPGEGTIIKGQNFEITFLKVLEDSRCPREVTCFWEGRARSLVSIIRPDSGEEVELVEPGLSDQGQSLSYQGYLVNFHLLPYPRAGVETAPGDYRLSLTITKTE